MKKNVELIWTIFFYGIIFYPCVRDIVTFTPSFRFYFSIAVTSYIIWRMFKIQREMEEQEVDESENEEDSNEDITNKS